MGKARNNVTLLDNLITSVGASLIGFIALGTGAIPRTLQDKAREWVSPQDKGAVADGVTDDATAYTNAAGNGALVVIPKGNYKLASTPTAPSVGFLADGKATFVGNYPPGAVDGSVYGVSGQVLSYHAAAAGSAVGGSANEFAGVRTMKVPATASAASYEKAASYARIQTDDPSTALILRDAVAAQHTAVISAGNALGRLWATHSLAQILATGDGYLVGHEIEIHNGGSTQTALDTTTSKYGLHVVAAEGRTTAGLYLDCVLGGGLYEHGIYIKGSALNTNAITLDSSAGGAFSVTKAGALTAATLAAGTLATTGNAALGGSPSTTINFALSGNITGAATAQGAVSQGTVQSGVTSQAVYLQTTASTAAAAFTLNDLSHILITQGTIGAGSAVTSQYGVKVGNTLTGATNNFAFYHNMAAAAGRWGFYGAGSAANYVAGSWQSDSTILAKGATAIPAGGAAAFLVSSAANFGIYFGSGAPTVSAAQGSIYCRSDGSSISTRFYVNTNGTTGWTNVTTAA